MATDLIVKRVNQEISEQFSDKNVVATLISTTFKGMSETTMKKAIMEGMIRGFEFKDFLNKDVYAISYGNDYSLVTSIDYMRKVAAQNGQTGKDEPFFEDDENGNPKTCSLSVYRNGNKYTAKVYFNEYSTGKNQWLSKPRTMLAKVAEMHALRMAFPEELSKSYIEEEQRQPVSSFEQETNLSEISNKFNKCTTENELIAEYKKLAPKDQTNKEVVLLARERKIAIKEYEDTKDAEISGDSSNETAQ